MSFAASVCVVQLLLQRWARGLVFLLALACGFGCGGCICATVQGGVFSSVLVDPGEEPALALTLHRLGEIPEALVVIVGLEGAPLGSEIRVDLEPGLQLVGTGAVPTVRLDHLNDQLSDCDGGCVFPVTATIADAEEAGTVRVFAEAHGGLDCTDVVVRGGLEAR